MEVRRELVLAEEPAEVWAALTQAERLAEWFAPEAELDARPDGEGRFRWPGGEERRAVVEEVEPERLLAFRWRSRGGESRVRLALEAVPLGTRLTVTESLGPRACAEWGTALALRALLRGRVALPA